MALKALFESAVFVRLPARTAASAATMSPCASRQPPSGRREKAGSPSFRRRSAKIARPWKCLPEPGERWCARPPIPRLVATIEPWGRSDEVRPVHAFSLRDEPVAGESLVEMSGGDKERAGSPLRGSPGIAYAPAPVRFFRKEGCH